MPSLEIDQVDQKLANQNFLARLTSTAIQIAFVHALMAVIFIYFSIDKAPLIYVASWIALWSSLSLWRLIYYLFVIPNPSVDFDTKRRIVLIINSAFGIAQSLSVIFFMYFTFIERVIYTLIMLGTVSGSVTIIGFRSIFVMFATPIMLSLALVWAVLPYPDGSLLAQLIVSALILLYFAILVSDSQSFYNLLQESNKFREKLRQSNAQLNIALENARKASESKTRFLASASHDLRQPIHTMSLLNAALQMQKMDGPTEEIADRLGQAIDILAAQMDSLLDISKFDAGLIESKTSTFDLHAFCTRLQNEYSAICETKGLTLNYLNSTPTALVESDPNLLERILRNLLSNAIRYTTEGSVNITLSSNFDKWRLTVSDTGKGISDDDQEHIFEEFFQVENLNRDRTHGLGLGLAIAKRTAQVLDTEIEVDSEVGGGSTFSIEFPKAVGDSVSKINKIQIIQSPIQGLSVLFIDDELHVREALKIALSSKGCEVTLAENSTDALELSRKQHFDLIIADLRLAESRNGIEAIKLIWATSRNIPALLISGDTAPEQLKLASRAGIKMLHKPVDIALLEQEIGYLINQ